jgi:AcrR family transcriptional regulator
MKTIKQMADELGVDKLRVYRYIRKQRISETYREHRTEYYDETAEALIEEHFKAVSQNEAYRERITDTFHERFTDTGSDTVTDTVISMLQRELDNKNRQIEELTAALISAQDTARAAQALHAGTIQAQLGDGRRGGLWARLFQRKEG